MCASWNACPLRQWCARGDRRVEIHTPELDGVSGATVWAVDPDDRSEVDCVLRPAAIQVAFHHGRHVRGEPIAGVADLLAHRH